MAKLIPESFVHNLLARIDLVEVVSARISLKKAGKNYLACCPFHQEKTPSFSVVPDKQFYHCFGCGASGDAISFIRDFDRLDFVGAVEILAGYCGLAVPQGSQTQEVNPCWKLLEEAGDYFQRSLQLSESQLAREYLLKRSFLSTTCARFVIGFAPSDWNRLSNYLIAKGYTQKQLIEAGLLVEQESSSRSYDRFRNRIIFPIRNRRGKTIGFGGRSLGDEMPKYLNSPESQFFHKGKELYGLYEACQSNRDLQQLIVVEGYTDVLMLNQQGVTNVVASLGTALTEDHLQKLFKEVKEIYFCFDGDVAGKKAAWRALESSLPYMNQGFGVGFLFLPEGEDPDSLARRDGGEAFKKLVAKGSIDLADWLFMQLQKEVDLTTLSGRNRLIDAARTYIQKLDQGLYRTLLINRLAEIVGITQTDLALEFEESEPVHVGVSKSQPVQLTEFTSNQFVQPKAQPSYAVRTLPVRIIRLLLQKPSLAMTAKIHFSDIKGPLSPDLMLLKKVFETLAQKPSLSSCYLLGQWQGTSEGKKIYELVKADVAIVDLEQEFIDAVQHLNANIKEQSTDTFIQLIRNSGRTHKDPEIKEQLKTLLYQSKV